MIGVGIEVVVFVAVRLLFAFAVLLSVVVMIVVEFVLPAPVVAPEHQRDFWLRVLLQRAPAHLPLIIFYRVCVVNILSKRLIYWVEVMILINIEESNRI